MRERHAVSCDLYSIYRFRSSMSNNKLHLSLLSCAYVIYIFKLNFRSIIKSSLSEMLHYKNTSTKNVADASKASRLTYVYILCEFLVCYKIAFSIYRHVTLRRVASRLVGTRFASPWTPKERSALRINNLHSADIAFLLHFNQSVCECNTK